jgi:PIN domain nuclease of toxin-antitoxin system
VGGRRLIVLDTHAWIWWRADPARLSDAAAGALAEDQARALSAISVWELGMLVRRGRISLDREVSRWVRQALAGPLTVLAVDAEIALAAALLDDEFPGDPADRLIYATARGAGARLLTRDRRIARFDPARVVW